MKALIWDGEASVKEVPIPPIPRGWVLGEVLIASLSSIDAAVTSGITPLLPGIVLGSYGVIRVIEPGVDTDYSPGEVVGVTPLSKEGILALNINGLMSEYSSVPSDCLRRLLTSKLDEVWVYPLMLEYSFVPRVRDKVVGKEVLIMGTGISTYILASYLKSDSRITVLGDSKSSLMKKLAGLGVRVISIKKSEEIINSFDAAILCAMNSYLVMISTKFLTEGGTLVIPPNTYHGDKLVISNTLNIDSYTVWRPRHGSFEDGEEVIRETSINFIKSFVGITNSFEEAAIMRRHYARVVYISKKALSSIRSH